ncbi:hypothetical protein [Roseibium aestuarii]|uniref:DUF2946 domain-containing protein n=1 Tax=Roseibium aestuarii TaxID=2600299 RepID=A0ABW4JYV4_9HYPH|nr:hypothetical protein [Roseibium aestuarii]
MHTRQFYRLAATLLLAFALVFVARAPMQHQMAQAAEMGSTMADMPCDEMAGHASHSAGDETQSHDQAGPDTCCGGALCTGYTLTTDVIVLAPVLQTLSYLQSQPKTLRVADIGLPKRPPRYL